MNLATTQTRLWQLLTAPSGVREALAEAGDPEGRSLDGFVVSDERAPAALRLEIYANAYFQRIHDVLAQDFDALAAAIGEDGFHDLVTAYLCVHTPSRPSLRHAGEHLADFLAEHAAAAPFRKRWPWAADLAQLDWALVEAFDAAEQPVLARETLAATPPEAWESLGFALQPSARLLALAWDVARYREAFEPDPAGAPATPEARASLVLVWRRAERVLYRRLDDEEAELLTALRAGDTFGAVCDRLAARHDEAAAPARAAAWLAAWIDAELLVASGRDDLGARARDPA